MSRPATLALAWLVAMGACERNVTVGREDLRAATDGGNAGAPEPTGGSEASAGTTTLAGAPPEGGAAPAGAAGSGAGEGGAGPTLLWSADHETGSLEQWLADGDGHTSQSGNGKLEVTTKHAHSGDYAIVATITANDSKQNQGLISRDLRLKEGRYSAWYYLPEAVRTDYWVLMKLSNGSVDRFDLDIESLSGGEPHLRLYEHGKDYITDAASVSVPVAQWFHVEILYRSTPDADGRLVIFQDGQQVLDTGPRVTAADDHVVFACGSSSRYVSPAPYSVFIDDASIESAMVP